MSDILTEAKALQEQIVADRRHLHQIPEVGLNLPESAAYIEKRLTEMGISFRRCGVVTDEARARFQAMGLPDMAVSTGIVATIGSGSPCILLRADFDALPMGEINDLPFCSKRESAAHMCGHDTHASMLLAAAKMLKERESELKGTVKLMFQPGEEVAYGAKSMVDDGVLQNPKVDAAMAIHIMSTTPVGKVTYTSEIASSSLDSYVLKIQGKGGHTSMPDLCVDPLMISNQIYTALNMLMTREVSPQAVATLSTGIVRSGTAINILPDTAEMAFGFRTYDKPARDHLLKRIPEIVDAYVKVWRGEYTLLDYHCPCTYLDNDLTNSLLPAIGKVVGEENVLHVPPLAGTEDFGYVSEQVPSTFLLLGAGGPDQAPHHNPRMVLDESVFYQGAALYAGCAVEWLEQQAKKG